MKPSKYFSKSNVQSPEGALVDATKRFERVVAEAFHEGLTVPGIAGLTGFDPYEIGQVLDRYAERERETP